MITGIGGIVIPKKKFIKPLELPTQDLILHLDPSNTSSYSGSGTSWNDLSSGGNDATLNSIDFSSYKDGVMMFNATSDYAPITLNTNLSNTAYTKCAWVNFNSFSNYNNILSGGNNAQHALWTFQTNRIKAGHNNNWGLISSDTELSTNTWYFVTLTFSTTNGMKLYIDGTLDKSAPTVTSAFNTNTPQMLNVARYHTSVNGMLGSIGLILAYNREISSDEVSTIYNLTKQRFQAASFSPTNISGLELWLKSDAGVLDASDNPITTDNTQVKTWQDQSGNDLHATQSTSARQPVWRSAANGINGNPAVYFSGDMMQTGNLTAGVYTIFAVHKATYNGLVYERSVNTNSNAGEYLYTTTGYTTAVRRIPSSSLISGYQYTANWGVGNNTLTTCHQFDGTHAGHGLRVNGSQISLTSAPTNNPGTGESTEPFFIGARSGVVAPLTGFISEILYYSSVLSASDISDVEDYLIDKWGT